MTKMKNCKACNAEIAKSAKVCPMCGAKNKQPIYKRWWFWTIIGIIAISIISNSSDNSEPSVEKKAADKANTETVNYNVGDVITTDKFEIEVTGVCTKNRVGTQYLSSAPAEGGIYVCVDFSYKNIASEPISSFSCPKVKLVNENGTKYSNDISASSYYATETDPNRKILSDLNPGIKVNDSAVFEISQETYETDNFYVLVEANKKYKVKIEK